MANYIAGGLMILLLLMAGLFGVETYGIYHAAQMVEAALLDAQPALARDGGVTPAVRDLVRQRVMAEGGDSARLMVSGSPAGSAAGRLVMLQVVYLHPYALPVWPGWRLGTFRVERQATTLSGWRP